jgi:hypothetical protein
MVFNATLINISVISWRSVLVVKETGVPRENYRPVTTYWQTLSHNVISSTPRLSGVSNFVESTKWYVSYAKPFQKRIESYKISMIISTNYVTYRPWNVRNMNCSIRITSPHLVLIVFHVAPCCFCVSIIIKLNILLPNKDLD